MEGLNKGRGYFYKLRYVIIWKSAIDLSVYNDTVKNILNELCKEHNIKLHEINFEKDNVILDIEVSPQHYIPTILKTLKGVSARKINKEINSNDKVWQSSYTIKTK